MRIEDNPRFHEKWELLQKQLGILLSNLHDKGYNRSRVDESITEAKKTLESLTVFSNRKEEQK